MHTPQPPHPPPLSTPCSPYIDIYISIYLWVASYGFIIGYRDLVFDKKSPVWTYFMILSRKLLDPSQEGEERALPLPHKHQIINR